MGRNIFFIGKGGVGKSTIAATTALYLSNNKRVVLISLDPAHNQSDIFKIKISDRLTKITGSLWAREVDEKKLVKKYLKETENQLKANYSYQTAFNLDKYLDLIQYSPGMEEYALLNAFKEIVNTYTDIDYIIFDMPPTALTMKFFRLPSISLVWLYKLKKLRKKIMDKKEIISTIQLGKKELQRDRALNKLSQLINEYESVQEEIRSKNKTSIFTLLNPDRLSLSEHDRIKTRLNAIGIPLSGSIINKSCDGPPAESCGEKTITIPYTTIPLAGRSGLQEFIHNNRDCYTAIMDSL